MNKERPPSFDAEVWRYVVTDVKTGARSVIRWLLEAAVTVPPTLYFLFRHGSADAPGDYSLERLLAVPLGLIGLMLIHLLWSWATASRRIFGDQQTKISDLESFKLRTEEEKRQRTVVAIDEVPEIYPVPGAVHSIFRIRVRHVSGPPNLLTTVLESAEPAFPGLPLTLPHANPADGGWHKAIQPGSTQLIAVFVNRVNGNYFRPCGGNAPEVETKIHRVRIVSYPVDGEPAQRFFIIERGNNLNIEFRSDPNQSPG